MCRAVLLHLYSCNRVLRVVLCVPLQSLAAAIDTSIDALAGFLHSWEGQVACVGVHGGGGGVWRWGRRVLCVVWAAVASQACHFT